jgi:hypothetical protein
MLVTSETSIVLLINPHPRWLTSLPARFRTKIAINRIMLRHFVQVTGTSIRLLGEIGEAAASFRSLPKCEILSEDAVAFWRNKDVERRLGPADRRAIFLGGAWLDEHVFAAALTTSRIGYDVRVLVDVSVAKTRFERVWALERFQQHGVKVTTMRQTMTEWSLSASDEKVSRQLRDMLQE